jgi:hypothetical protein
MTMNTQRNRFTIAGCVVLVSALCACGGGGGGSRGDNPATTLGGGAGSAVLEPAPPSPLPNAWAPQVTDTWQWQLQGTVNTSYQVTMYDVDLFTTPQATIDLLKSQGKRVVCYFSAGSYENFRPDSSKFAAADKGSSLKPPFADELWLDTRSANVREIMKTRLDLAVTKRCDGVEPDNMDGYQNAPGLPLDADTQIDYNTFIAKEAKSRGLRVGLKNDTDQLAQLETFFDFAVNEQCHEYGDCEGYGVFTSKNKPVFNAEYQSDYVNKPAIQAALCASARSSNLRTLVLPILLDNTFRISCD